MNPKTKTRLINLALVLVSVGLSLTVLEIGLRYYFYGSAGRLPQESSLRIPHPTRGWSLAPGRTAFEQTLDYSVMVRINSKGFRDLEREYEPEPGVYRIVILGDSFMEAYQVALEKSLPRLLEKNLADRGVEVINLGVGGYGTAQELLTLEEEGLKYKPDLVILALYANDLRDNSRRLTSLNGGQNDLKYFARPFAEMDGDMRLTISKPDYQRALAWVEKRRDYKESKPFFKRTLLYRFQKSFFRNLVKDRGEEACDRINLLFGWTILDQYHPGGGELTEVEYDEIWSQAWRITRRLITETWNMSEKHGARFLALHVPASYQVDSRHTAQIRRACPGVNLDPLKLGRELVEFGLANGIEVVDPTEAFMEAEEDQGPLFHHREDRHWNAAGHRLAASILTEYLIKRGYLPPPGKTGQ